MVASKQAGKAVAKKIRRVHSVGRKILKDYPTTETLGAEAIVTASDVHEIKPFQVRDYRNFARKYTPKELTALCGLCENYNWSPGFTTIAKLLVVEDTKVRHQIAESAAKGNWSLAQVQTEIFRRQGRRQDWAGRKPKLPASREEMLLDLQAACIRWRRLHKQLAQKSGLGAPHVRLVDLPGAVRERFVDAARAIAELEDTIGRWRPGRH